MRRVRANSSPELTPSNSSEQHNDSPLEGVAANVKLLYKLVQDHSDPSKGVAAEDSRRQHRVAGILTILDDIKSRVNNSNLAAPHHQHHHRAAAAELRRCNTELRRNSGGGGDKKPLPPMPSLPPPPPLDPAEEVQRLRRELAATTAARKSLERMFSSLGKEKEMIAAELAMKVRELDDAEEAVGDLRSQNERLLDKVKACAAEHKAVPKSGCGGGGGGGGGGGDGDIQKPEALHERNKALSEQLLRTLDSYRGMKRTLKEAQDENTRMTYRTAEIGGAVKAGIERIRRLREKIGSNGESEETVEVTEDLDKLESLLLVLRKKLVIGNSGGKRPDGEKGCGLVAENE